MGNVCVRVFSCMAGWGEWWAEVLKFCVLERWRRQGRGGGTHSFWMSTALTVCSSSHIWHWRDQFHHFFFFYFACGHIDSSQAVGSDMTAGYVWASLPGWFPHGWRPNVCVCVCMYVSEGRRGCKVGRNSVSAFSFPQGKYLLSHLPN